MGKPKTPSVPPLPPEAVENLRKQGVTLDMLNDILGQERGVLERNRGVLQRFSGIFNADGTPNQVAIDNLRDRIFATRQQQEEIGQQGLDVLGGILNRSDLEEASDRIGLLEAQRLEAALRGDIPISEGQRQREAEDFARLKEAAGQRGIRIEGDTFDTASSQSTAGNQLIKRFRDSVTAQRDAFRQAEIQNRTAANLNRLQFGLGQRGQLFNQASVLSSSGNPGDRELQFFDASNTLSPAQLGGFGLGVSQGFGAASQPFIDQRNLQFQAEIQNQANRNALTNSLIGLGGTLGGAALFGQFSKANAGNPNTGTGSVPLAGFGKFTGTTSLPAFL